MIRHVSSFRELLGYRFSGETNAACWPRLLAGDFAEVVRALGAGEGVVPLDESRLRGLQLAPGGRAAIDAMLADLQLLRDAGREPVLNIIYGYPHDEEAEVVATDVYSWHVDSAPIEADTWLCTYHGAASEALEPADARRKVDDPQIRARLRQEYGGVDDAAFGEWLTGNHYDLHYAARDGATLIAFGQHSLWRLACAWPGSPVPGCVHRAPRTSAPRLLLIS